MLAYQLDPAVGSDKDYCTVTYIVRALARNVYQLANFPGGNTAYGEGHIPSPWTTLSHALGLLSLLVNTAMQYESIILYPSLVPTLEFYILCCTVCVFRFWKSSGPLLRRVSELLMISRRVAISWRLRRKTCKQSCRLAIITLSKSRQGNRQRHQKMELFNPTVHHTVQCHTKVTV